MDNQTFQKYVAEYIETLQESRGFSELTQASYREKLERFSSFVTQNGYVFTDLKRKHFDQYAKELFATGKKAATVNIYLIVVRSFLKYLMSYDIACPSPFAIVLHKAPTQPVEKISDATVQKLLADQPFPEDLDYTRFEFTRARAAVLILLGSGLRRSELISFPMDGIDKKNKSITIVGKGKKPRLVFLTTKAMEAIEDYKKTLGPNQNYPTLFFGPTGKPVAMSTIQLFIDTWCKFCGVDEHINPHKFRHTFATRMIEGEVSLYDVQKMLGHSSPATTQIYAHVSDARLQKIHQSMDN